MLTVVDCYTDCGLTVVDCYTDCSGLSVMLTVVDCLVC